MPRSRAAPGGPGSPRCPHDARLPRPHARQRILAERPRAAAAALEFLINLRPSSDPPYSLIRVAGTPPWRPSVRSSASLTLAEVHIERAMAPVRVLCIR